MPSIHPDTSVGAVDLIVSDLERSREFYEGTLGFIELERSDSEMKVGVPGSEPLVILQGDREAPPRPPRTAGLFHFAILVPTRGDLALVIRRLAERGWPLTGASDHLVSEAIYLHDPDGIGIEIYRDRPREEWQMTEEGVRMATLPLDLQGVMRELGEGTWEGMPEGTRIGHVHLNVADLEASERFYSGVLGFDVTVRGYRGALFVSAGGYHHHLGLNIWNGEGVPPPPDGAIGLGHYEIVVPNEDELGGIRDRLDEAGNDPAAANGELAARDPSGLRVAIRSSG